MIGWCSLVSADLATFARSLAPHLPAAIAVRTKDEVSLPGIPDPSSALHGEQPSSSSHTPSSSSYLASDNSASWELGLSSGDNSAQTPCSARTASHSLGRSSGSLGTELPACPEGVVLKGPSAEWKLDEQQREQQRPVQGTQAAAAGPDTQGNPDSLSTSNRAAASSPHSTGVRVQCSEFGSITILTTAKSSPASDHVNSSRQEQAQPADSSNRCTEQLTPAWDDMKDRSPDLGPDAGKNISPAPAGFALFDSASSDPGGYGGGAPKDGSAKAQHSPAHSAVIAGSEPDSVQSAKTTSADPDKNSGIVSSAADDDESLLLHEDVNVEDVCDTAGESDGDAPSAMPPKSGAQVAVCNLSCITILHSVLVSCISWARFRQLPMLGCLSSVYTCTAPNVHARAQARRARASRARAQARRRQLRSQEQTEEAGSSFRQWAGPGFAGGGGNGSDSDSPKGSGAGPYRRRSPQHPFWLIFRDPALEAAFVAWQAQQQRKVSACHDPRPCMEHCSAQKINLSTAL